MKYHELRQGLSGNIFTYLDILKTFNRESEQTVKTQISRFAKKGLVTKIKKGLYCFDPKLLDEFELSGYLYQPSYVSLETALNYYGVMPDIPRAITAVALTTTKKIENQFGSFYYTKIKSNLFWGFAKTKSAKSGVFFNLAQKEKALLDYFYLRKINKIDELRLDLENFNIKLLQKYQKMFPEWVRNIKL